MTRSKIAIVLSAAIFYALHAETAGLRDELQRAPADCNLVTENSARLMLAGQHSEKDIEAEWEKLCPNNLDLTLLNIVRQLSTLPNEAPEINRNLYIRLKPARFTKIAFHSDSHFVKLGRKIAEKQTPASTDAKLIQTYFTRGPEAFLSDVEIAKDGRFRHYFLEEAAEYADGLRIALMFGGGYWSPSGNLARLGPHPSAHLAMGLAYGRLTSLFKADIRFLNTPNDYSFFNPNTGLVQQTSFFTGFFVGADFAWELLRLNNVNPLLLAGIGYDGITHAARPHRYSNTREVMSDSLNYNAGLGARIFFDQKKMLFTQLEARYHRAHFKGDGPGADDLSGDYMTYSAALGIFIHMN